MIIDACYLKDGIFVQEWHRRQVAIARERLEGFPQLNRIMRNFEEYENLDYRHGRNAIFAICCVRTDGTDSDGYPTELEKLERALQAFKVDSWDAGVRREFLNRLANTSYFDSISALDEILTAYEIGLAIGFDKVQKKKESQVSFRRHIWLEKTFKRLLPVVDLIENRQLRMILKAIS